MNFDQQDGKTIYPISLNSDIINEELVKNAILEKISDIDKEFLFGFKIQDNRPLVIDNNKFNKIGFLFWENYRNITHILNLYDSSPSTLLNVNFTLRLLFGGNSGFQKYIEDGKSFENGDTFSPNCHFLLTKTVFNKKDLKKFNKLYEKIIKLTKKKTMDFYDRNNVFYILERFYYVTSGEKILFEDRFNNLVSILEKILVKNNESKSKAIAIRASKLLNDASLENYLSSVIYRIRSSITHNLRSSKMNNDISKAEVFGNVINITFYPNAEELKKLIEIVRKIILYYIENFEKFNLEKIAIIPEKTFICKVCNANEFDVIWE